MGQGALLLRRTDSWGRNHACRLVLHLLRLVRLLGVEVGSALRQIRLVEDLRVDQVLQVVVSGELAVLVGILGGHRPS